MIEVIALIAQLTAAQPAPASETPAAATEQAAPVAPTASPEEPAVRCQTVVPTGSRRPVRVCTNAAQDADGENDSENRQTMMRNTSRGASPGYRGQTAPSLPGYE